MYQKAVKFLEDVKTEMGKVSWPTRQELVNSTMIVAVVSVLFTIYIFGADFIVSWVMRILTTMF